MVNSSSAHAGSRPCPSARRPWRPAVLPAGIGLIAVLIARSAQASFELDWRAPSECPSAEFVAAEVQKVVGRPWRELGKGWRGARARVTAEGGGYRLHVTVVSETGNASEREVLAASCTEAAEAAVAILATGMASQAQDTPSGPAAPAAGATELEGAGEPSTPSRQDDVGAAPGTAGDQLAAGPAQGAARVRLRPLLGARLGADFGTLSGVAPFAEVTGGFELARFELLGALGVTGKVLDEVGSSGAGAQMYLLLGSLSGCWRVNGGNPALKGCAGAELGSLEASGFGTAQSRAGRALWSAGTVEGVLDWQLGGVSYAALGVRVLVPFRQLHVAMPPADVHRTYAVAVRPWLGFGLRFR